MDPHEGTLEEVRAEETTFAHRLNTFWLVSVQLVRCI